MTPTTSIGAATPVSMTGDDATPSAPPEKDAESAEDAEVEKTPAEEAEELPGSALERKVLNFSVSEIRSYAERYGRNADWAELAVTEAATLTASEALEQNVIDYVAADRTELLGLLDGLEVETASGEQVISTSDAVVDEFEPNWRIRLLTVIANPEIVLILGLIGLYGLMYEGWNPGASVPGGVGAICLLLAAYALQLIPVNYACLALILIGVAIGASVGGTMALRVPMTAMPEMVALFDGCGGLASLLVAVGVALFQAEASDLVVADEADDGHKLLNKIRKENFDVVILDITMPHMDGLDVLKQLKIEKPKLPVIVLSIHPEDQYALRVLKAGAAGYVTKASAPDELINAIRKVYRGGKYISPAIAEKLAFQLDANFKEMPHEALSDREYQVLCLLASGKTVTDMADELALSVKTISTYRARILEKMDMKNNAELIHYAVQNRLVE